MIVQVAVDDAIREPILSERWRARLDELGPGLKVGLAWRTSQTWSLRRWGPILSAPGARFISLEAAATESDLRDALNMFGVLVHRYAKINPSHDADQFASLVAAHDLVIAVNDDVARLAGELDVPCWRLLAGGRDVATWQPNTRLFRQSQFGDWRSLIHEVARELERLIRSDKGD